MNNRNMNSTLFTSVINDILFEKSIQHLEIMALEIYLFNSLNYVKYLKSTIITLHINALQIIYSRW